jgi:hypothetical protein
MHPTDSKIDRALVYFNTLPFLFRAIVLLAAVLLVYYVFDFITNEFL